MSLPENLLVETRRIENRAAIAGKRTLPLTSRARSFVAPPLLSPAMSMSDRRRTPRYVLGTPLAGDALPMQDVMVESLVGTRLVVIAPSAPTAEEELMIHLAMSDGLTSHRATLLSSSPISVAGTVSFRLELRLDEAIPLMGKDAAP